MITTTRPQTRATAQSGLSTSPTPAPRRPIPVAVVALLLGTIFIGFAGRCWPSARWDSITSDETTHLIRILNLLHNGDDLAMWELGAPRLPHAMGGLASYGALRSANLLPETHDAESIAELVVSGRPRVLVPARVVAIAWGLGLIGLVFWWVARTQGMGLGLLAAALVSMVPEVLAHSSIAGSDMPFTTSAFLAILCLVRYAERPSPRRWIFVSMAIGLAWAMRHTALLLLMLAALAHLAVALRKPREPGVAGLAEVFASSGLATVAMTIIAFAVLWAGDGFGSIPLREVAGRASGGLPLKVGPVDVGGVPVPTSALSVIKQVRHQNAGHEAFLCGEVRQDGWATYFPIAFALKTPTGLLALMVLAIARYRLIRATPWSVIAATFLAILWVMLIRNKVNIGVRYALLTYPLMIPFVVQMFGREAIRDRVWGPITVAASVWFVAATIAAHPHYLSSFNEIGGGPRAGWLYLADSNVDWGQDLDALANTLVRLKIHEVTTDISTERRLNVPGIFAMPNPSQAFQVPDKTPPDRRLYDSDGGFIPIYTRYVAVSVSRLHGLYSQNDMSWLRTRKLVERVGDSIFLFDMDEPADRTL